MLDSLRLATMAFLLVPLVPVAAQRGGVAPPDAATLKSQFDEAQRQWNLQRKTARTAKDNEALARLGKARPQNAFVEKFKAGAAAYIGQEKAVPYLAWLVSRAPLDESKKAMSTLMEAHVESPGIRLAVARIGGLKTKFGIEQSRQWLDRVLAKNLDPHVLAQARFTRAAMHVGTRAVSASPERRALAIADLEAALVALGDQEDGASLRGLVTRLLDEAQRLEPGLTAPEIEGKDLDGVPFKLSDYRGKVVMLDFWGDW